MMQHGRTTTPFGRPTTGDVIAGVSVALVAIPQSLAYAELAGMPTEVLAEQLGTNPNALYKLVHDARRRLRAALERDGFSAHDVRNAIEGASQG